MDARTQRRLEGLAEARGARGFTFDDVAALAVEVGAGAQEVADWLTEARASGYLADLGAETLSDGTVIGPQRYCLAAAVARRHSGSHVCGEPDGNGEGDASRSAQRYAESDVPVR